MSGISIAYNSSLNTKKATGNTLAPIKPKVSHYFSTAPLVIVENITSFFCHRSLHHFKLTDRMDNSLVDQKLTNKAIVIVQKIEPCIDRSNLIIKKTISVAKTVIRKKTTPQQIITIFKEEYPGNYDCYGIFYRIVLEKDIPLIKLFIDLIPALSLPYNIYRILALNFLCDEEDSELINLLKTKEGETENKELVEEFVTQVKNLFEFQAEILFGSNDKADVLISMQGQGSSFYSNVLHNFRSKIRQIKSTQQKT